MANPLNPSSNNISSNYHFIYSYVQNPSSLDAIATPLDPVTTPPASAVQPSGGYFQSLHQARQFTVAVYYLSLPVVMDSVKNNYGCRLYSGWVPLPYSYSHFTYYSFPFPIPIVTLHTTHSHSQFLQSLYTLLIPIPNSCRFL